MNQEREEECGVCEGTGLRWDDTAGEFIDCDSCGASGFVPADDDR